MYKPICSGAVFCFNRINN